MNGPSTTKRLVRSRDERWLAGVCGGVAEYAGVDATLVRLLLVLGTIFSSGCLLLAYVAAWVLMPEE
jgi:phage shock protein PspC (stress-responsive transcriptional regulator)